jgi:RNA polymerase sigma factor (sigma-70 family)
MVPSAAPTPLETVYRQHVAMVRSRAYRLLLDHALAEDVTQETFMAFIAYRAKHAVTAGEGALLYVMATRIAISHLRKRTRTPILHYEDFMSADLQRLDDLDLKLSVRQIVAAMQADEAQAGALFYGDGHTQEEVADAQHTSLRTAGRRLRQFRQRLRTLLLREQPGAGGAR